jgi:hypothetical protein
VRRVGMIWAAIALLGSASPRLSAGQAPDQRGDIGVRLALTGEASSAESVFVTMLSHTRGDARALNNLGNLRLLHGETGVALAFYDRALRGDSLDPGINLNRATALMMLGDQPRSQQAFAVGVKLAGGLEQAEALLGLPPESQQPADRAASKTVINAEQLHAMLKKAAASVPKDSLHKADPGVPAATSHSAWRQASARASDGSNTPLILYWKR